MAIAGLSLNAIEEMADGPASFVCSAKISRSVGRPRRAVHRSKASHAAAGGEAIPRIVSSGFYARPRTAPNAGPSRPYMPESDAFARLMTEKLDNGETSFGN